MSKKWEAIRGSAGFFVTMAVCLLVIGVSSYFLLVEQETKDRQTEEAPASAPVSELAVSENSEPQIAEEPETVAVLSPELVETAPSPMPEVEVDDVPVVAQAPRVVVAPLQGEILAAFSVDELAYNETLEDWRTHDGVDISAQPGATVLAACSGTVTAVEDDALLGTMVVLEHDGGYQTTYANLQAKPAVLVGDSVSAGQIIGAVGDTAAAEAAQGPHLHFSVAKDGEAMDPNVFLEQ